MKTIKKFNLALLLIVALAFSSCLNNTLDELSPSTGVKTINDLVATSTFNWKTTQDYQFTINDTCNAVLKITSANGVIYHKGFMKANTPYKINLTLPSYVKSVHLINNEHDIECPLTQRSLNYSFNTKRNIL